MTFLFAFDPGFVKNNDKKIYYTNLVNENRYGMLTKQPHSTNSADLIEILSY